MNAANPLTATPDEQWQLARALYKGFDALGDVAKQPTVFIPPALWQPLNDAYHELGSPDLLKTIFEPAGTAGSASTASTNWTAEDLTSDKPFDTMVRALLVPGSRPAAQADLPARLAEHGFAGAQLRYRVATIDHFHADYVAHGRAYEVATEGSEQHAQVGERLGHVFGAAETVLGSVVEIEPFGVLKGAGEVIGLTRELVESGVGQWMRRRIYDVGEHVRDLRGWIGRRPSGP